MKKDDKRLQNLRPFTKESGAEHGRKPKTPRIKSIARKYITTKVPLSPEEKLKLEKFLGVELKDGTDHETILFAGLLRRARTNDNSMKLLYDLIGEKIVGDNSEMPTPEIHIGFDED